MVLDLQERLWAGKGRRALRGEIVQGAAVKTRVIQNEKEMRRKAAVTPRILDLLRTGDCLPKKTCSSSTGFRAPPFGRVAVSLKVSDNPSPAEGRSIVKKHIKVNKPGRFFQAG
jgi:hypothetical protein